MSLEQRARNGDLSVGRDWINRNILEVRYNPEYYSLNQNLINSNSSYADELRVSTSYKPFNNVPLYNPSKNIHNPIKYILNPFTDKPEDEELILRLCEDGQFSRRDTPSVINKFIDEYFDEIYNSNRFKKLHENLMKTNDSYYRRVNELREKEKIVNRYNKSYDYNTGRHTEKLTEEEMEIVNEMTNKQYGLKPSKKKENKQNRKKEKQTEQKRTLQMPKDQRIYEHRERINILLDAFTKPRIK